MNKFLTQNTFIKIVSILCITMLMVSLNLFVTCEVVAMDSIVSLNKPVVLVNSLGIPISYSEIPLVGSSLNVVDRNNSTFTQASSTMFGVIIHLGGLTEVSSVGVTNYWANYITKYDIKASEDGVNWITLSTSIAIGASQTKLTTFSSKYSCRFIWVAPTTYSSSSWYCISEVSVYGQPQPNYILSSNRLVTLVDSSCSPIPAEDIYLPGSNLVDGNKTNYAQTIGSLFGAKIDLGGIADITKIEVANHSVNYITKFNIKASSDGINWTDLATEITMNSSENKMITLPSVFKGRYIWIDPVSFSVDEWRCFSEISIYGQRTPPTYGYNENGGRTFSVDGRDFVAFGIDLNSFESRDGNLTYLKQQMDATVEINGNFVGIPVCWSTVEPTMNNYTYTLIDSYIEYARQKGLKVSLMWHGSNYASGNNSFVPLYIINDANTYSRNAGSGFSNYTILCPSNKNTINRERAAYNNVLNHIRDYDVEKTVLCVATSSEIDYLGGLKYPEQFAPPEIDIRCECSWCNALYQNEGNVAFMEKQFSKYARDLYDFGALVYNLPSYSAVCANSWFEGWRYAENPNVLKTIVNNSNHIVVPSIANAKTITNFKSDMDLFTPETIPGNIVFVDGIDVGSSINDNVECAPWITILHYGGLGAIYWDAGTQNTQTSIVSNSTIRNKLRKYFAPLKGVEFYLAKLKNSTSNNKFWWQAGQASSSGSTANYSFKQTNYMNNDYGVAFEIAPNNCIFTGSTYAGSYTIEVSRIGGFDGFKFEKGYFDPITGGWIKYSSVTPSLSGNKATMVVSTADAGRYERSVYRFYDDIFPVVNGVTNNYKGTEATITFTGGTATLNGNKFISVSTVKATGNYFLSVKDDVGNKTELNFTIVTIGDVNGDGIIDVADLSLIRKHLLRLNMLEGFYAEAGDPNGKDGISISDIITIKKQILGIKDF